MLKDSLGYSQKRDDWKKPKHMKHVPSVGRNHKNYPSMENSEPRLICYEIILQISRRYFHSTLSSDLSDLPHFAPCGSVQQLTPIQDPHQQLKTPSGFDSRCFTAGPLDLNCARTSHLILNLSVTDVVTATQMNLNEAEIAQRSPSVQGLFSESENADNYTISFGLLFLSGFCGLSTYFAIQSKVRTMF